MKRNEILVSLLCLFLSRTMCLTGFGTTIAHLLSLKVSQSLTKFFLFSLPPQLGIYVALLLRFLNISLFKLFLILLLLREISLNFFLSERALVTVDPVRQPSLHLILFYLSRSSFFFRLDLIFVGYSRIMLLNTVSHIIGRSFLDLAITFLSFRFF